MALAPENQEQPASSAVAKEGNELTSSDSGNISRSPVHPIPRLQGPFEESILESIHGAENEWVVDIDAQSRRKELLENAEYERLCGRKWRQRAGERYHPFWKLISQISFGVHLLVKGLAKSDMEVSKILQTHVEELDGFIERATDDFLIIEVDVRIRIQYLSLPLQNLDVFDGMLHDRNFRLAMIEYNEKIEHAIGRFTIAVQDSLKDIEKGKESIGALWHYLRQSAKENKPLSGNLVAIYNAMLANTEGWNIAFSKLRRKGAALEAALVQLRLAVTEMQRRVGVASRKDTMPFNKTPISRQSQSKSFRKRYLSIGSQGPSASDKPLPRDPDFLGRMSTPPVSRQSQVHRMAQKSVPDLRATRDCDSSDMDGKPPNRTKSANGATEDHDSTKFVPKLPRSLSKRLSKARLTTKKPVNEKTEPVPARTSTAPVPARPSTAPARTLRSRSISLEQLKSFRQSRKEQQQSTLEAPALPQLKRPIESQSSARQETMKIQLLHYFKTDKVIDAWESTVNKRKKISRHTSQWKKEGPMSVFRAKSSNTPDISGPGTPPLFEEDLEKQMAWLQEETGVLNTYSLRPKSNVAPRIHVLSVHTMLAQEPEGEDSNNTLYRTKTTDGDAHSIITALPSVPSRPAIESLPRIPRVLQLRNTVLGDARLFE